MIKVTMPDPFGWLVDCLPNGGLAFQKHRPSELQSLINSTVAVITTSQVEAYANSRLAPTSQALEVAQVALERICAIDRVGECESIAMEALSDIRALISKEDE